MADLSLLLLTLAWGTTFTFVKDVLAVASPGLFLAARFVVAAAVLAAVWAVRRDRPTPGLWRHGFLLGLTMLAGFALQTVGLQYTTPARSGFITGLSVLVVPFIARFLLGRSVKAASWGGVALAVIGLGVLSFAGGVDAEVRLGDLLTLGCAVAYALQIVWTSEWAPRHPLARERQAARRADRREHPAAGDHRYARRGERMEEGMVAEDHQPPGRDAGRLRHHRHELLPQGGSGADGELQDPGRQPVGAQVAPLGPPGHPLGRDRRAARQDHRSRPGISQREPRRIPNGRAGQGRCRHDAAGGPGDDGHGKDRV